MDTTDIRNRLAAIDLTAIARQIFYGHRRSGPAARDLFAQAAQGHDSSQSAQRLAHLRKADDVLVRRLAMFADKVREQALPVKEREAAKLQSLADQGRDPKAIWDRVIKNRFVGSFHIADLAVLPEGHSGLDGGRTAGKSFVSHLRGKHPAFWQGLQDLFVFCEENDIAIHFISPRKTEDVPQGYKNAVGRTNPHGLAFSQFDIVVSPLDSHYRPLTMDRFGQPPYPDALSLDDSRDHEKDIGFNWSLRAKLHPSLGIVRLLTGRHYRM